MERKQCNGVYLNNTRKRKLHANKIVPINNDQIEINKSSHQYDFV